VRRLARSPLANPHVNQPANRLVSLAAVPASWPGFVPVARRSEPAALRLASLLANQRANRLVKSPHVNQPANRLVSLAAVLASWPGSVPVARRSEPAALRPASLLANQLAKSPLALPAVDRQ